METGSDVNSIKSAGTPSSLKTPNSFSSGSRKQVGFTRIRPTLIIPPPQGFKQPYTATAGISGPTPIYIHKQSTFIFDQLHGIKDLTKSGLGLGEKCAFWLYSKLKEWSRKWLTHMFLSFVLIFYTIGGALIFESIEGQHERSKPTPVEVDLRTPRNNFIRGLRNLSIEMPYAIYDDEWIERAYEQVQDYEGEIIDWYTTHQMLVGNTKGKRWTFLNSVVFCGTIYTSIGYGHIYPETRTGKALTIVYAIIGIPLFLLALTDFGKLFTRCIKFLWSFVRRLYYTGSCRTVRKTAHVQEIFKGAQMVYDFATFRRPSAVVDPENPENEGNPPLAQVEETPTTPAISNFEIDDEFNLPISLAIFILIVYILLGGLIYCIWEGWGFFDSFYFVFISMSTIGFGDMVPDDAACMIVSIVYLVFGLALMSMCINVVQVKLSDTFKQASSKIGATIGITVADDDGSITTIPPENVEMPQVHDSKNVNNLTPNDINGNDKES